ncbi:MAG TPA: FG-GAP-like repeat-containing protein [Bacteroidota bacterium]|nr:FG-GAP-like repeat-containing protein [Bacteroidota bacterium]
MRTRLRFRIAGIAVLIPILSAFVMQSIRHENNHPLTAPDSTLQWNIASYPTKNRLITLVMTGPQNGFIAERYLMEYRNGSWKIFDKQPPIANIHTLFARNLRDIWAADVLYSFQSNLYHFNGRAWERIEHPFANMVDAIHFLPDGTGWIAGTNELAYFNGKSWEMVPFPPIRSTIFGLFGEPHRKAWLLSSNGEVFRIDEGKWTRYLSSHNIIDLRFTEDGRGCALAHDKAFVWDRTSWRATSSSGLLKDVVRLSLTPRGELWGVGAHGVIVHFDGAVWKSAFSPTEADLKDIQMTSDSEGWIIGGNGLVLRMSAQPAAQPKSPAYGFEARQIAFIAKEINDEYGVAIEDLDGDGLPDVMAISLYDPNRLYMNKSKLIPGSKQAVGTLQFVDEAILRGVTGLSEDSHALGVPKLSLGLAVADVNNNGSRDLYVCYLASSNKLFLNDGKGFFRDVSHEPNRASGENERSNCAIFGDVDNDGYVDLFVTNEESTNRLYHNDGTGHFIDITDEAGLRSDAGGMGASFGDIDGDGKLDLCVANWSKPNRLYRNVSAPGKGIRFEDITEQSGIGGESYAKNNAVVFADVDNNGTLDLFITKRGRPNRLYLNDGTGRFADRTKEMMGLDSLLSYGASFADFDNDGFLDLYVACVGQSVLYHNIGGRRFVMATDQFGANLSAYATGTAIGDLDNDGDIDLYTSVFINGMSTLFINSLNDRNFLTLDVEGTRSNRDAIGAKVTLFKEGGAGIKDSLLAFREINGGSGYGSHNSMQVHFGADVRKRYDIVIDFPASGLRKVLRGVQAGQHLNVREEDGWAGTSTRISKSMRQFVLDRDTQIEMVKFALVLLLLAASLLFAYRRYSWGRMRQFVVHGSVLVAYWGEIVIFLHEPIFLSTVLPLLTVLVILSVLHLWYDRIIMVRRSRLDRETTRARIARDLHDDIASTLSSALIYLDSLRRTVKINPRVRRERLDKISDLLTESADGLGDIVWTMSRKHHSLGDLLLRIRAHLTDTCKAHSLQYTVETDVAEKTIVLADGVLRNVHLIFKEALNNVVKHSRASAVQFTAAFVQGTLELELRDDGQGIPIAGLSDQSEPPLLTGRDSANLLHGHGLKNMKTRAEEIGARLRIKSRKGAGTAVMLSLKLK